MKARLWKQYDQLIYATKSLSFWVQAHQILFHFYEYENAHIQRNLIVFIGWKHMVIPANETEDLQPKRL